MLKEPTARVPVRIRLALWYAITLFLVLGLFGLGTFYATRASTVADYDRELRLRLEGIAAFLSSEPAHSLTEIQHELHEDSELRPEGELLQIRDGHGNWIYQSDSIRRLPIPWRPAGPSPSFSVVNPLGIPVRLLSAAVNVRGENYTIQIGQSLEQSAKLMRRFGYLLIATLPFLVLAVGAAGYWMAGRALQPVIQITADARAITASRIQHRIKLPPARDELRDLSQTLNDMLARLESAIRRITQFTADASHELRTPIALIRTTAELALTDESGRTQADALKSILAESEHISHLVESLLTLARADANAFLPMSLVDGVAIARDAFAAASAAASTRNISLRFNPEVEEAAIIGHATSLRRLFLIFLDNGIKYSGPGGQVVFTISRSDDEFVFAIEDNGIGIADEDLPHIFERFYRADKSRDRATGVGLGLSIAEQIATAHHTSIEVSSVLDQGACVKVRFPVAESEVGGSALSQQTPVVVRG